MSKQTYTVYCKQIWGILKGCDESDKLSEMISYSPAAALNGNKAEYVMRRDCFVILL